MTRGITITNTSNWENEDYAIVLPDGKTILKPGESKILNLYAAQDVSIEPVEEKEAVPFYTPVVQDGKLQQKQLIPRVLVVLG